MQTTTTWRVEMQEKLSVIVLWEGGKSRRGRRRKSVSDVPRGTPEMVKRLSKPHGVTESAANQRTNEAKSGC